MQKTITSILTFLVISVFYAQNAYALSGNTIINKDNQLMIEEILVFNIDGFYEFVEYSTTAATRGVNPYINSTENVSSKTDTSNLMLNLGLEMDIAPSWFIGTKYKTNISAGSDTQVFTSVRTGSLEYERSDLSLFFGKRFFFVPTAPKNLLQLKLYGGLKYSTSEATLSDVSYPVSTSDNTPDNITDKSQSINAIVGLSLSRRFKENNFVEFYTELGIPVENETKSSFHDGFSDTSDKGSAFETGISTTWQYTPQSFFALGVYYGVISFDGGELTQIDYTKGNKELTTYYQWGENETTYYGIKLSCLLKF